MIVTALVLQAFLLYYATNYMENQEITWLLQEKYNGIKTAAFEDDCARLAAGEPLGYLIGHIPFLSCTIHLDSHPLIPRVETEFWTEQVIKSIQVHHSRFHLEQVRGETSCLKVLDLCAGSGAIGVAVAKAIPEALMTFTEIDSAHLPTIERNITENLAVQPFIQMKSWTVVESDLFSALAPDAQFDFILTNPPYIDASANTVDQNVVAHEPHLALFGGVSGMETIARIIAEAPQYLTPAGQLWIEHEPAQVAAITALAHTHGFSIVTHLDQYDVPRFSVLTVAQ